MNATITGLDINGFSSATAMLEALRTRKISAVELLDAHLQRIQRYDPKLNSIVVKDFERAARDAQVADDRRAGGAELPMLGLPITAKESIDVQGLPTTAGVVDRGTHRAAKDAPTITRLREAGAIVLGKTNVCTWLADYQADNPVYGRTNSPWDLRRTAGGSSGGSATLAAGLTALDLGSDLGGSIRVPPAFSGLFGHKPSAGIVPNTGHFPGSEYPNPALPMAAQGPQARSAADLELALDIIAGPDGGRETGWRLQLPTARHERLSEFRVGILPAQSWLPVDAEILAAHDSLATRLRQTGARVVEIQPPTIGDLRKYYALFRSLMAVTVSTNWSNARREQVAADKLTREEEFHAADAQGILAAAPELVRWLERRESYRAGWREFFKDYDILLTPMTLTTAFEHTAVPNADRRLKVGGRDVEFEYMSFYPGVATLAGLPATAFPAGLHSSGLPMGLQAVGPFLEDRTTLRFASLIEQEFGGFRAPPGYDDMLG